MPGTRSNSEITLKPVRICKWRLTLPPPNQEEGGTQTHQCCLFIIQFFWYLPIDQNQIKPGHKSLLKGYGLSGVLKVILVVLQHDAPSTAPKSKVKNVIWIMQNGRVILENILAGFCFLFFIPTSIWSSSPTPRNISKWNYNIFIHKNFMQIIIVVLFYPLKTWKQLRCPLQVNGF